VALPPRAPDFCSIAAEDPGSNDNPRGIEGHRISQ
jgi:hypothetical protein